MGEFHQMRIRLPERLKLWVEAEAKRNQRSQNGEIVFRLDLAKISAEAGQPGEPAAGNA